MVGMCNMTKVKSRKEHICDLCACSIDKGANYIRLKGKFDGDFFDNKYHPTCHNIISAYCKSEGVFEYDNDCIADWLRDRYCVNCQSHKNDTCEVHEFNCSLIKRYHEDEQKG